MAPSRGLVGRSVKGDQDLVDFDLAFGVVAEDRIRDLVPHGVDGLADAHALVAVRIAVAQLDRLVGTRGSAGGHRRAAERAVLECHLHLDGGVAAAIEDLAGKQSGDRSHVATPS